MPPSASSLLDAGLGVGRAGGLGHRNGSWVVSWWLRRVGSSTFLALRPALLLRLGAAPAAGRFLGIGLRRRLDRRGRVLHVAGLLRLERRCSRRRVVPDHVELLPHRPQVGGGPVQEDTDREGHTPTANAIGSTYSSIFWVCAYCPVSADSGMFLRISCRCVVNVVSVIATSSPATTRVCRTRRRS